MKAVFKLSALALAMVMFYLICKAGNGFDALVMVGALSYWMVK